MDPAWLSLLSLAFVIAVAGRERVGIGVLSLALAWLVGHHFAGMAASEVLAAFPIQLFMVLFGVTLFFGLASENGTLERVTAAALRPARGNFAVICAVFFLLSMGLSMAGPGNIGAVALLAPFVMTAGGRRGMGAFFMSLVLICGANAGTFSPLAPTGIIANQAAARIGLSLRPWDQLFWPNAAAQTLLAATYAAIFWPALKRRGLTAAPAAVSPVPTGPFTGKQRLTLAAITFFLFGAVVFRADVGFLAIAMAAALMLFDAGDVKTIGKVVPWNVIMMVCGVSTLIQVCERTGALSLFTAFLARIADPDSASALLAWTSGMVSVYSSSSGVVLPTFIPLVPELIERMGGGSAAALVASISVGSHVVDVSPLSTLGALCIANAPAHTDKVKLFRRLLVTGLLASFYGALVSFVLFGVFRDLFFAG